MTASKREEIIKKLSAVDVKPFLKEKMKLSYLSWADAWRILTAYIRTAPTKLRNIRILK